MGQFGEEEGRHLRSGTYMTLAHCRRPLVERLAYWDLFSIPCERSASALGVLPVDSSHSFADAG